MNKYAENVFTDAVLGNCTYGLDTGKEPDKTTLTLLGRQNGKSVFSHLEDIDEKYKAFINRKLTKKKFRKTLQAHGLQRNDINRIMADMKQINKSYTVERLYRYIVWGCYVHQIMMYGLTSGINIDDPRDILDCIKSEGR